MADWIVTIPKKTPWDTYLEEIKAVQDGKLAMYYKLPPTAPRAIKKGDRCFVTHEGRVRGYMIITRMVSLLKPWTCQTTGAIWAPGLYLERRGPFYFQDGPPFPGFQGIREFKNADA